MKPRILGLAYLLTASAQAGTQYFTATGAPVPWDTSTANWGAASGGPYASFWTNGNDALFEGTGGTIIVGSVSVANLTFNVSAYVLSGGTVTVAGSTIHANQPVTISSVLAGTGPVTLASDQYTGPAAAITNPAARTDGPYMIGNVFSLANDATLNALGVYAGGPTSGTLAKAATAGVWDSGGTLLASVTVPVGTPISSDGYAYVSITPVALPADSGYTMGAQAGGGTYNNFFDNYPNNAFAGVPELGIGITSAVYAGSGTFARPTSAGGGSGRWGAANLQVSVNGISGLPNQPVTFSGLNTYSDYTDISGRLIYSCTSPQTWSGEIAGPGSLTQSGAGTLTLGGINSYTGTTTVDAGCTLVIGGAGQLGAGSYNGAITNHGTLDFNTTADQSLYGVISGTGVLTQSGSGTLTLASGVHNYTGNTNVVGGILTLTGSSQINNSKVITIATGATLNLSGNNNGIQAGLHPTPPLDSALVINGTINGTVAGNAHSIYCQSVAFNGGTMTGATGHSTYGMFYFWRTCTVTANGTGNTITCPNVGINAWPGQIATLTFDTPLAADELTASAAFFDANGGTGGMLVKSGAGTVTLSGNNTYLGTTTINGSTLVVTGSGWEYRTFLLNGSEGLPGKGFLRARAAGQ